MKSLESPKKPVLSVLRYAQQCINPVLGTCALLAALASSASASTWPLTGAVGIHDPALTKEGSTWWAFSTGTGCPIKYSANGIAWTQGVKLFGSEKSWWRSYAPNMKSNDVWAPAIKRFGSRTYCYYAVSEFGKNNSAIGLTSCSSIGAGDWRDDGMVISSKSGVSSYNAIDPNLFVDSAGKPWLVFGSWFDGIHVTALSTSTMKPSGSGTVIAKRGSGIENPCIVQANGYYYLFGSIDKCCLGSSSTYKIVYGRSTSITGPYLDKSGVNMLSGGGTVLDAGGTRWKGPGGQDFFLNGTSLCMIKHMYDSSNGGAAIMFISDIHWDSSKWPSY